MIEKTGERPIPEQPGTLRGVEMDNLTRYAFALTYVENKTVLDCACGVGYGTRLMAAKANFVQGWDYSAQSIEVARQHYSVPNSRFDVVDAEKILPKTVVYDTVVSFETIEHLANGDHFLLEIRQILKPDGTLVISTPFIDYRGFSGWAFHKREYTRRQLCFLLRRHFAFIKLYVQPAAGLYIAPFSRRFFEDCSTAQTSLIAVCSNRPCPAVSSSFRQIARTYFNGIVKRKAKDWLGASGLLKIA